MKIISILFPLVLLCLSVGQLVYGDEVKMLSYEDFRGSPYNVSYDNRAIKLNGQRTFLISGSIHYPRSSAEMWPGLLSLSKESGLTLIEMYIFWNFHETTRGVYDFSSGNKDFLKFISNAADEGLFINLRVGPYVCAEWTFGGLPIWLLEDKGLVIRDNNDAWKQEMSNFVTIIAKMVEPYLARNGGPIILFQIENEYGNIEIGYPNHALYVQWAADFANSLNLQVPVIMCQQDDAPNNVIQTCNGFYCDNWIDGHSQRQPNQPHLWTENWPGWFQAWGEAKPHRPSEDVAFSVARWVMRGGTHFNYYMIFGGTTFGRFSGGPYDITSYDYDVSINEYGGKSQPKYDHLTQLHSALRRFTPVILSTNSIPPSSTNLISGCGILPNISCDVRIYGTLGQAGSVAFIANIASNQDFNIVFNGNNKYTLRAWSVLIIDGVSGAVVFDTSIVNTLSSDDNNDRDLVTSSVSSIAYIPEPRHLRTDENETIFTSATPLEHIATVKDVSDFLLYQIDCVNITAEQLANGYASLTLNNVNDYVYVFWNDTLAGAYRSISSLSTVTVKLPIQHTGCTPLTFFVLSQGLLNYGAHLETVKLGLLGNIELDGVPLSDGSADRWSQQIGLLGESEQYYSILSNNPWIHDNFPVDSPFVWYRVTIPVPDIAFNDPSSHWALDLTSMGKGSVWCNNHHLGRFWNITATANKCDACDYRGSFSPDKCRSDCGVPTQSYYHIPQSWLVEGLSAGSSVVCILFDEQGGNPSQIQLVQRP